MSYEKICIDCGKTFETIGARAVRCTACQKKRNREKVNNYHKKEYTDVFLRKRRKAKHGYTLQEVTKLNALYNEKYKVFIHYGDFVVMLESGKVDVPTLLQYENDKDELGGNNGGN